MKLKNEQEIKNLAHHEWMDSDFTTKLTEGGHATVSPFFQLAYRKGYSQAQQDLQASASEGFEEWVENKDHFFRMKHQNDPGIYEGDMKLSWQAAKLSSAKEMVNLEKKLEKVSACNSYHHDEMSRLQKENEELKKDVEQATHSLYVLYLVLRSLGKTNEYKRMEVDSIRKKWELKRFPFIEKRIKGEAK